MTKQELHQLIEQGEGYSIEFKRELNADFKKEMVAFANASGGYILIGVEDNGKIKELKFDNNFRSIIQQHASECDPPVDIKMQEIDNVMVVTVSEGKEKPYRSTNGFYLRVGPNCQKMTTEKIAEFVEKFGRVRFDERVRKDVNFDGSLDLALVDQFIASAKIKNVFQNKTHILSSLGVVKQIDGVKYFTNAGILFFTTTPASIIKQSKITCVAYNGTEKVDILDRKDFTFDLITNIDSGLAFLRRHLNEASDIKTIKREDKLEIPLVALREALVNAVAHRNYMETGANVMIEIYTDRVTISNPGGLPDGLTEKDFGKYSLSRNPVISDLLLRVGLIEKLGTGVNRIKALLKEAKLPEAEFHFNDFFAVTFFRESAYKIKAKSGLRDAIRRNSKDRLKGGQKPSKIGGLKSRAQGGLKEHFEGKLSSIAKEKSSTLTKDKLKDSLKGGLKDSVKGGQIGGQKTKVKGGQKTEAEKNLLITPKQDAVLALIYLKPEITRDEIAKQLKINPSAVQKHIENLKAKGIIERIGGAKGGYWKINLKQNKE